MDSTAGTEQHLTTLVDLNAKHHFPRRVDTSALLLICWQIFPFSNKEEERIYEIHTRHLRSGKQLIFKAFHNASTESHTTSIFRILRILFRFIFELRIFIMNTHNIRTTSTLRKRYQTVKHISKNQSPTLI